MEHLEGIIILNEYMTYTTHPFVFILLCLTVISALIAIVWAGHGKTLGCIITFSCFIILLTSTMIGLYGGVCDIESGMVYECTLPDDVTYKELTQTYEIIEQRGDIYKLKFINN